MRIVNGMKEKYRKSNKLFLALRVVFSVLSIYFAIKVLVISITALSSSYPVIDNMNLLMSGMLFFLGLSNAVQLVEMVVTKKKKYFVPLLLSTIFVLVVSIAIFLI